MKPYNFTENEIVIKFGKMLKKAGVIFEVEVPFFSRSIDLVLIDNGKYHAIEFKLKNYKQAIIQAKRYMLGADLTSICMPKKSYNTKMKDEILKNGIGLIVFDEKNEKFETIKKPIQKNKGGRFLIKKGFEYAQKNNNFLFLKNL